MPAHAKLRQGEQQRLGVWMARILEDLVCKAVFHDLPGIHDGHAVCHIGDDAEVMRDVDDGHVQFLLQLLDELEDLSLNGYVECGGRFIADEDLRAAGNRRCNDDALAHTAGKLMGVLLIALLGIVDADLAQQFDCLLFCGLLVRAEVVGDDFADLLADGFHRVE